VPLKIEGHDAGSLLLKIRDDGKMGIFNPFHPEMDNFSRDVMGLEKIG